MKKIVATKFSLKIDVIDTDFAFQATQVTPKAPRFSGFDDDTGLIRRPDLDRNVLRHLFKKKCEREEREKAARAQLQVKQDKAI